MRTRKELEQAVIDKYRKCADQWGISKETAEKRARLLMPYNSDDNLRTFLKRPNKITSTGDLDPGHRAADKEIAKMSKEVNKVYMRAADEMEQKVSKHLEQFESADQRMKEQLGAGRISEQAYKDWRERNMIQGRQWEQMRDVLADDASRSNDIARDIVNGHISDIYAENYNYGTYQIEHIGRIDTGFTLYDRDTVNRLLRENPQLLPGAGKKTYNLLAKQKDLRWNQKHIQNELLQGILQGESIPNIAKRLRNVSSMNERASIRYARTMTTGAENAGRSDAWDRAQKMGVQSDLVWMATLDSRTRDSHRAVDGEVRNRMTGRFSNGLRFPGDPQGRPEEVYNCRCTLAYQVKGFENDFSDMSWRSSQGLGGMSYEEWKANKKVA